MANAADNFNRANGALGTASDGIHSWTTRVGTWAILSNQADPDSTAFGHATLNTDCADADIAVTITSIQGSVQLGVVFRWTDTSNYLFAVITTTQCVLRKVEGGSASNISTVSITGSTGDRIRVHAVGDQVSVYHTPNGGSEALAISAQTVSFNQTATVHGIFGSATGAKFDDFEVTDLGGGPSSPINTRLIGGCLVGNSRFIGGGLVRG